MVEQKADLDDTTRIIRAPIPHLSLRIAVYDHKHIMTRARKHEVDDTTDGGLPFLSIVCRSLA